MNWLRTWCNKLRRRAGEPEVWEPDRIRATFKERYHHFKLLLSANNRALEVMAEIEAALKGTRPFGMNFVRSRSTMISAAVYQIVHHMNRLAPEKYADLVPRYKTLQQALAEEILPHGPPESGPLVLPLASVTRASVDHVGGKMAHLGESANALRLLVPDGFVVTADGYRRFMAESDLQTEIDRKIQSASAEGLDLLYQLSGQIQDLIIAAPVPEDLTSAMTAQYRTLEAAHGPGVRLAMRSSALGEDLEETSFAGQYRTQLNVSQEHLVQAYKEIVASKYGLQAVAYRLNRGIRDEDVAMCVGCMCMVQAVAGGVMYTRNPLNIRDDAIFIHAVWGLPKTVVDGSVDPDQFVVRRGDPLVIERREIRRKPQQYVCNPEEGIGRQALSPEQSRAPSVNDDRILELGRLAMVLEDHFQGAQDVEWAVDAQDRIFILQCRPLRQLELLDAGQTVRSDAATSSVLCQGGVTACSGVACGSVFVVRKEADALRFPQGAILLTLQARPRWATLLHRAAGVVTQHGSVAGHLASVAREFQVPALFGVTDARDRLASGQLVTVDATGRKVFQGRVEELLRLETPKRNPMHGSPVFTTLERLGKHILPLHLVDPDDPGFRAKNCRTLHDITRFCHEKAVQEMFRFGRTHRFPERSSKQLVCDIPMQWWVLNLDDGFLQEVDGKYVVLNNIASRPMLALWDGITAVSWEGPPAIDGKGLASVFFHATTNPALAVGVRSGYGNRNYFMISRDYCCLNSRFGFHFSTVESLMGTRVTENYIRFRFQGGAADPQRRSRRIEFVAELLEAFDFAVSFKADRMVARLEGLDERIMAQKLKILGYLTMHTRQLDMIMSNPARVSQTRAKMRRDIEALIAPAQDREGV